MPRRKKHGGSDHLPRGLAYRWGLVHDVRRYKQNKPSSDRATSFPERETVSDELNVAPVLCKLEPHLGNFCECPEVDLPERKYSRVNSCYQIALRTRILRPLRGGLTNAKYFRQRGS